MAIRALDLFCGAGGSGWGAYRAGAEVVAAFDQSPLCGKVYTANIPTAKFFEGDLASVKPEELKDQLGKIDLIMASPECTNHSPAKGAAPKCEKSRETAFQVTRFTQVFQPTWVIIENVVSMRKWLRYPELMDTLREQGYHIKEQVLDSSAFGVPQKRRRLFVMCSRLKEPAALEPGKVKTASAKTIIDNSDVYRFTPLRAPNRAEATLKRAERAISELGPKKPFLLVYYGSDHAGGWQSLDRPLRTITTLDRFALVKPDKSGHMMRMLQPEELKKAMGWPADFSFSHGARREKVRMIGNAVSPVVMSEVIRHLTSNGKNGAHEHGTS